MSQIHPSPTIIRSLAIDNPTDADFELLTITSEGSASVHPSLVKIISDNVSSNQISQKIFTLKNDDYTINGNVFTINIMFPVLSNNQYTIKAKVIFSDGNFSPFSSMTAFTASPTTPQILSAFGDSETSIFLTIVPQK